jgi:hypothetical protein
VTGAALLAEVIEAHGGREAWQASRELVVQVSAGGLAVGAKFQPRGLRNLEARVATDHQRVVFTPYPRRGHRGVFDRGAVRIEAADGGVIHERSHAREDLNSPRRLLWWDNLDLLYFGASSLWIYMAMPFILADTDFKVSARDQWVEHGKEWRRLAVTFPAEIHTHSLQQVVYVGDDGLIRRHDYTAEEFGAWAASAHYWFDHHAFDGLIVPRKRRVLVRRSDGRSRGHPILVWINVLDVSRVSGEAQSDS